MIRLDGFINFRIGIFMISIKMLEDLFRLGCRLYFVEF